MAKMCIELSIREVSCHCYLLLPGPGIYFFPPLRFIVYCESKRRRSDSPATNEAECADECKVSPAAVTTALINPSPPPHNELCQRYL